MLSPSELSARGRQGTREDTLDPVVATDPFGDAQYVSLLTTKLDGTPVATAVWFARVDDEIGIITESEAGKVKRIRHTPAVTLAVCDVRGRVAEGEPRQAGVARLVTGDEALAVRRAVARRYGLTYRLFSISWVLREFGDRLRRRPQPPEVAILVQLHSE